MMRKNLFALAAAGAALAAPPAVAFIKQGAGFAEAWGHGTIAPTPPCAVGQSCEQIATGTGTVKTFFDAGGDIGDYAFRADFTFDLPDSAPNGFGRQCHPVGGTLTITPQQGSPGTLVLDIEGEDCALGASTTQSTIAATYVVDGTNSTGRFAGASWVGAFNWQANTGALPAAVILAFSGNLHF